MQNGTFARVVIVVVVGLFGRQSQERPAAWAKSHEKSIGLAVQFVKRNHRLCGPLQL